MKARQNLLNWYNKNKRNLPWRETKDAYRIWISEVMLQQTRAAAVIDKYHSFLKVFPDLKSLAQAKESQVLAQWAGLGYYSRAKNLHKAAKQIASLKQFPQSFEELLEIPGFGPYTARAVASFAFGQQTGLLDGNIIRILSRYHALPAQWWKSKERDQLQELADQMAIGIDSDLVNQAMMELGATICLPKNPVCNQCPWFDTCEARKQQKQSQFPLKKAKKSSEIWELKIWCLIHKNKWALHYNTSAPFLKNYLLPIGQAKLVSKASGSFDFKHSITHHDIFVKVEFVDYLFYQKKLFKKIPEDQIQWIHQNKLKEHCPSSLADKILALKAK